MYDFLRFLSIKLNPLQNPNFPNSSYKISCILSPCFHQAILRQCPCLFCYALFANTKTFMQTVKTSNRMGDIGIVCSLNHLNLCSLFRWAVTFWAPYLALPPPHHSGIPHHCYTSAHSDQRYFVILSLPGV